MNLYQPTITGSLSVSGSVNISGSITIAGGGTISGTASIATTALTASFVANAQTASYVLNAVSSSFALTASSADNLLVRNTLTATTLVVQTVTSSVIYSSGSNIFGNASSNTQTFTGSVNITGSMLISGSISSISPITSSAILVNPTGPGFITIGATTSYGSVSSGGGGATLYLNGATRGGGTTGASNAVVLATDGDYYIANGPVNSFKMFVSASGNVGIGTTSPAELLEVSGSLKIGNLKIQNVNGGSIGLNRNTATGAIYNSGYAAFQINGAYAGADYLHFQNYNSSGSYVGGFVLNNGNVGIGTTSPNTVGSATTLDGILNVYNAGSGKIYARGGGSGELGFEDTGAGSGDKIARWIYDGGVLSFQRINDAFTAIGSTPLTIASTGNITIGGNIAVGGVLNMGNSYDVPNALTIQTDANWTFGCSNVSSNYWMQVKFYGDGTDTRGFRVYNVQNALVEFRINAAGNAYTRGTLTQNASDKRLKTNIINIDKALEKVMSINGVNFDWIENIEELGFSPKIKKNDAGLIAQEIQSVLPQAIDNAPFDYENGESRSGKNYLTVQYEKIVPLLVEAIKELKAEFDAYKTTHP